MGAKLWYRSCPAVSHISNLTVSSFTARVCEKKAAPMVDSWNSTNWPFTNRRTRLDLPAPTSPRRTWAGYNRTEQRKQARVSVRRVAVQRNKP
uniref:Uncharacterized protein n=1 Tax=Zea mays TaxID=4577 RepID=B7ZZI7_MAIZE|nr:unknown [Zea mays]